MASEFEQLSARDWQDYSLLDSGAGRKLEQFGPLRLIRPEERATWKPVLPREEWEMAYAEFQRAAKGGGGKWDKSFAKPERSILQYKDLMFYLELASSMQVGVFPENAVQWDWIQAQVQAAARPLRVLNLFGYTGLASLAAAAAGAEVTHVDASKRAVRLGQENQRLSELGERPIRWLVDDALKFVERESRRANQYDGLILDPPAFGRGPDGERWAFFDDFPRLCESIRAILSPQPAFVVVTAYAINSTPEVLREPLRGMLRGHQGDLLLGELVTLEKSAGRRLHYSLSVRWSAK